MLHNVYKLEQISYNVHDIVGLRLNAVLIGHKSQKYGKYHYKRNVYNWQCLGLILRKNRMVKGGVLKTWFWAISELFTTS